MSAAGEVVRLASGGVELEVLPAFGARIHRLRVDGHDLIRTPADPARHVDDPYFWGSYVMAPWCNRLDAGTPIEVAGRMVELPVSFRDGTAIHGQVSQVPWRRTGAHAFAVEGGGNGWPWRYAVDQSFEIADGAIAVALGLTNLDDAPMPAGIGIHPWWRRPVRVAIAARSVHPSMSAAGGDAEAVAGRYDRRALEELPDGLDATWTDLDPPPVVLDWPASGIRMTLTTEPEVPYIVAASPGEIDAVAVEPETHAPGGLRRLLAGEPGGLALLEPGATLGLAVRIAIERRQT